MWCGGPQRRAALPRTGRDKAGLPPKPDANGRLDARPIAQRPQRLRRLVPQRSRRGTTTCSTRRWARTSVRTTASFRSRGSAKRSMRAAISWARRFGFNEFNLLPELATANWTWMDGCFTSRPIPASLSPPQERPISPSSTDRTSWCVSPMMACRASATRCSSQWNRSHQTGCPSSMLKSRRGDRLDVANNRIGKGVYFRRQCTPAPHQSHRDRATHRRRLDRQHGIHAAAASASFMNGRCRCSASIT